MSAEEPGAIKGTQVVAGEEESADVPPEESPEGLSQFLEGVPPEFRRVLKTSVQLFMARGRPEHETLYGKIVDKFGPEHVTYFLESAYREAELAFKDAQRARLVRLVWGSIIASLFVFLVVFLSRDDSNLLKDILTAVVLLAGGFGAGYGVLSWRGKASE